MPDDKTKESFPMWLMHAVDRMLMPKNAARKSYPPLEKGAAERFRQESGAADGNSPEIDDIALQVERLKRRNKVFAAASPDEWNK